MTHVFFNMGRKCPIFLVNDVVYPAGCLQAQVLPPACNDGIPGKLFPFVREYRFVLSESNTTYYSFTFLEGALYLEGIYFCIHLHIYRI